jgi:hypothetical protein
MKNLDPARGTQTLLLGLAVVGFGLAGLGILAYFDWQQYVKEDGLTGDAWTGTAIVGGVSLLFVAGGGLLVFVGRAEQARQREIAGAAAVEAQAVAEGDAGWRPGPAVVDHLGRPLPSDRVFFVEPPPEIGPVVSAYSSLKQGVVPRGAAYQTAATICWAALGFAAGWLLGVALPGSDPTAPPCIAAFGALFAGLFAWGMTRFKHACHYVGTEGVARFLCLGSRDNLTQRERFLFRDAFDLRISETEVYGSVAYQKTRFSFDWTDAEGKVLFQITGSYIRTWDGHNPWLHAVRQFAGAAANAWKEYRLHQAEGRLR